MVKSVDDDKDDPTLDLIFTHTYDDVEINTAVPWEELSSATQALAKKVVDYYQMFASVKVDAHIKIRSLNITDHDPVQGLIYSLITTVEALGDNEIDVDALFDLEDDDGDHP